jgi:hypothetical protein
MPTQTWIGWVADSATASIPRSSLRNDERGLAGTGCDGTGRGATPLPDGVLDRAGEKQQHEIGRHIEVTGGWRP